MAAILLALPAAAQLTTSPYSMYGYGIIGDRATSMQRQMGGVGYAMNSGRQVNVMNPASYASIDSLTFIWDMGADLSLLWSKENTTRSHSVGGGLDYLTMQFPISKHMGGSAGLIPYSSVGYAFGNKLLHGTSEHQGSGGINQAYIGVAGTFAGFSLGANVSYDFGKITNDSYTIPTSGSNTIFEHEMRISDWNLTIGAQYTHAVSQTDRITLGLAYTPKKNFHGRAYAMIQDINVTQRPDTVGEMKLGGNYSQPNTIGGGISYTHSRDSRWSIEADFTYQDWAKAKFAPMYGDQGQLVFAGMTFNNRYKVALGGEYINNMRGSYGQRMAFRLGAYYTNDYIKIGANSVKEAGVSFGVGLPTPEGKTVVNLGLEYKRRWATPSALITENYFNITLGINFNEVWFWRRKIN